MFEDKAAARQKAEHARRLIESPDRIGIITDRIMDVITGENELDAVASLIGVLSVIAARKGMDPDITADHLMASLDHKLQDAPWPMA